MVEIYTINDRFEAPFPAPFCSLYTHHPFSETSDLHFLYHYLFLSESEQISIRGRGAACRAGQRHQVHGECGRMACPARLGFLLGHDRFVGVKACYMTSHNRTCPTSLRRLRSVSMTKLAPWSLREFSFTNQSLSQVFQAGQASTAGLKWYEHQVVNVL